MQASLKHEHFKRDTMRYYIKIKLKGVKVLKRVSKKESLKANRELLKTIGALENVSNRIIDNMFPVIERLYTDEKFCDMMPVSLDKKCELKVKNINDCIFALSDLIEGIKQIPVEIMSYVIDEINLTPDLIGHKINYKNSNMLDLKTDMIDFLSTNIACNKKYKDVNFQEDKIYFTVGNFFELLSKFVNALNQEIIELTK